MTDQHLEVDSLDEQVKLWVDISLIASSLKAFKNKDASYDKRLFAFGRKIGQEYSEKFGADFVKNGIKVINEASDRMLPSLKKNKAPEEDLISLIITCVIVTSNFPDHGLNSELLLDDAGGIFSVVKEKFEEALLEAIK